MLSSVTSMVKSPKRLLGPFTTGSANARLLTQDLMGDLEPFFQELIPPENRWHDETNGTPSSSDKAVGKPVNRVTKNRLTVNRVTENRHRKFIFTTVISEPHKKF